jgi:hypothetical protein
MITPEAFRAILLVLLWPLLGGAEQASTNPAKRDPSEKTFFVRCNEDGKPNHVLSPVSFCEGGNWRAYVEADTQGGGLDGCANTTRLWVARAGTPYRLVYLMPPEREDLGNGMQILGWARHSRMLLVRTERWQWGSDAMIEEGVLAIDAGSGVVYEPNLDAMLDTRKDKQCFYHVKDAGFAPDGTVTILVRAQISMWWDPDETEDDVPPAKRCPDTEETWSFNFGNGEIKQVANTQRLELYKTSKPAKQDK